MPSPLRGRRSPCIFVGVREDRIEPELYNHNWTHGQLLPMRAPILRLCRELRKQHPASWAWSAHDPEDEGNQRFVDGAVALANAFYRGLAVIGAFDMDPWGYRMPPDASMGQ
jgi:hypothetical protein